MKISSVDAYQNIYLYGNPQQDRSGLGVTHFSVTSTAKKDENSPKIEGAEVALDNSSGEASQRPRGTSARKKKTSAA